MDLFFALAPTVGDEVAVLLVNVVAKDGKPSLKSRHGAAYNKVGFGPVDPMNGAGRTSTLVGANANGHGQTGGFDSGGGRVRSDGGFAMCLSGDHPN